MLNAAAGCGELRNMDCRILRQIMLKADGHLVCDDSNGYFISLGEVSTAPGWSISQVLAGGIYSHVRRSFSEGRVPWPSVCETCDLFSKTGIPADTLDTRLRIMVEPTLACKLACPTCKRVQEAGRRSGNWDMDPSLLEALLRSCSKQGIVVEEVHYLGWGEPLLHDGFAELTKVARRHAPNAVQEVTTTGNVAFHAGLKSAQLDRLVISCDGVRQEDYEKFRRKGNLEVVFQFMRDARHGFDDPPFMEWKYILFEHNDSDEEIGTAQEIADAIGLDSILFITTNSKWNSKRFSAENFHEFPLTSKRATIMPAAAMMKTRWTASIVSERSSLGRKSAASLYLDRCTVTESNILVVEGWSLCADFAYVEHVELIVGNQVVSRIRPQHRRLDVKQAIPAAEGPDCGFMFRFPIEDVSKHETLLFVVTTATGQENFRAQLSYRQ